MDNNEDRIAAFLDVLSAEMERAEDVDLREVYEDLYCEICDLRCIAPQERAARRCAEHLTLSPIEDMDETYHGE